MDKKELHNLIDRISLTGPGGVDKIKKVLKELLKSGGGEGDVTEEELQEALAEKQDTLVSGTNIKTINGNSILGNGNIQAGDPDAVKYVSQALTEVQKQQARANINAASLADIQNMDFVTATALPTASASTMGHIYLIGPDSDNNYERYYTQESNGTYSWVSLGSTQLNLSTYASKEEVSQLRQKVNSLPRGKDYGFFTSSSLLPSGATEEGFAYVGATEPYAIWQFDGTTWTNSGVTANAFTAMPEDVQNSVDEYLEDHPTVSGTFLNAAKRKLIALLEKVAFIDEHGQDYINELTASLFLSPIDHIDAVFTQGTWNCYDIYRLEQLKEYLVVTVYYVDGSHSIESDYILTGTLAAGTSTITASVVDGVTGDTVTDTFNVTVIGTTKLYVDGDECTAVTGGWQKKGFNLTAGTPTIAKNSDHLLLKFATWNNASAAGTISTVNKIDVSGKTKCLCEIELYNETGWAGGWIYFPGTLAESTTQAGAFGSDYSSNRSMISVAPGSVTLVTGFQEPNVITTRTSDYISINFNAYQANNSGYTPGAYLKVKRIAIV